MTKDLINLLNSGKIVSVEDAQLFTDNAEFFDSNGDWDYGNKIAGDFRIDMPEGFYEIYGIRQNTGDKEEMPIPYAPQDIRFYSL